MITSASDSFLHQIDINGLKCVHMSVIVDVASDCRASEHVSSARCLFQAVRSYLHFSQLSAWLNATHGTAPQYIGYRLVAAVARLLYFEL